MVEEINNSLTITKEMTQPEGTILNLASGEIGIALSPIKAIIAASLDECALIFIQKTAPNTSPTEPIAAGIHYKSPESNEGNIKFFYRMLSGPSNNDTALKITVVWGRRIHPDNKTAVLEEIRDLEIKDFNQIEEAAQGVLILETGEVITNIPEWIREEIENYYQKKLKKGRG